MSSRDGNPCSARATQHHAKQTTDQFGRASRLIGAARLADDPWSLAWLAEFTTSRRFHLDRFAASTTALLARRRDGLPHTYWADLMRSRSRPGEPIML